MKLVRWQPFEYRNPWMGFNLLQRRMNRLFDDLLGESEEEPSAVWSPRVDVTELDDKFVVTAELPGLAKGDVKVEVKNGILSISGEKRSEQEKKDRNIYMSERCFGKFNRTFQLPDNVSADKIGAEFNNGVLNITLPKLEESKPKQIEIKIK